MGSIKWASSITFTKYVRKAYEKAFKCCCADSCLRGRSEPFSNLPLSSNCSKSCPMNIHLAGSVCPPLAPLNSVKKTSFNGIGAGCDLNNQIKN